MRLHKTGHPIADTVSDLIGDLPDGNYQISYGILRHNLFGDGDWYCVDKGFWLASHYEGNYRIGYRGTQPKFDPSAPKEPHGLALEPWIDPDKQRQYITLICPPSAHVCQFFNINYMKWLVTAAAGIKSYHIRHKGVESPIEWDKICEVRTFNSTIAIEALKRGIPVISDPIHSSVGNFCAQKGTYYGYDRDELLSFLSAHQFKLTEKDKICRLVTHYLST